MKLNEKAFYALVDCNTFYVSCERVFNPKARNAPVVVLSNNDGCVISSSKEAKKVGVEMCAPFHKFEYFFKRNNVQVFSSNYALYADISNRVMSVLREFSPNIEVYSIDEAFLFFYGFENYDLEKMGDEICKRVYQYVGVPVTVGFGKTKTMAKLANNIAKKQSKNFAVLDIQNKDEYYKTLQNISVADVWGIGRRSYEKLNSYGIYDVYKFIQQDDSLIRKLMTVVGLKTANELRGILSFDLLEDPETKKSIMCSRSFSKEVTEFDELFQSVSSYVEIAAEKMRRQNLAANVLGVAIFTNRFKESPYSNYQSIKLQEGTFYTPDIIEAARLLLKKIYRPGFQYNKTAVMLSDLVSIDGGIQPSLFSNINLSPKQKKLMNTIDSINKDLGRGTLQYASSGIEKKWQVKFLKKSPHYTTCWDDILRVK